ncbi:MAG: DUF2292 domain-containing protein [Dehalobacterium sp.]
MKNVNFNVGNTEDAGLIMTRKERKIVELIRKTEYGAIKIYVHDHEPIRIEEITKSIKL